MVRKKTLEIEKEIEGLKNQRNVLLADIEDLKAKVRDRKKELEALLPSPITKPPVPALKPCRMICHLLQCPFETQCWEPEKFATETEKGEGKKAEEKAPESAKFA